MKKFSVEIGIFFLVTGYFFFIEGFGCKIFTKFDFDAQAFLFWQYALSENHQPYKDIFYPYGLLYYFKDTNMYLQLLFCAIPGVLCGYLYFLLKKIYESSLTALILVSILFLFLVRFIGLETVGRYGVIVVYALFFGWIFAKQQVLRFWMIAAIGISIGVVFSLLNDQGAYATILFFFFLLLTTMIYPKFILNKNTIRTALFSCFIFCVGFFIGILPLLIYLFLNESISSFFGLFLQNSDIALFAKTPFPPYAASSENLFIFLILLITIASLFIKRYINKTSYRLVHFLQLSIVVVLILLEQKSIIRSIAGQITFIALLLYFFMGADILSHVKKEKRSFFRVIIVCCIVGICLLANYFFQPFQKSYHIAGTFDATFCMTANKESIGKYSQVYNDVVKYISSSSSKDAQVFSYPGDPLFYVLFSQTIPYYPSNYEASPLSAQKKQIAFMRQKKIEYVIYNTDIHSIQDGVPDYIRNPVETAYIFTHFSPIKKIGSFLLFKRKENADLFVDRSITVPVTFSQFLLNVPLKSIPKSEGMYKKDDIHSQDIFIQGTNKKITTFLTKHKVSTKDLFLFVKTQHVGEVAVVFTTQDTLRTNVTMNDCLKGCIVNVSRLPLFYTTRILENVEVKDTGTPSVLLFKTKNQRFW